ncbi:MAG: NUDIX domain-containing protein [Chitinophagaceae bacterium]|nr:NUDIX domain-containing protein [Anaerolineae bacterium]
MKPGKIRPLALCIFRRGSRILVAEGYDVVKDQVFYRPIGGKIEFGERGAETIMREVREEIHEDVKDIRYLTTLESIFTFDGQPGHEIVLIYDGKFVDESVYEMDSLEAVDKDGEYLFIAVWKELEDFLYGSDPLYPEGLYEFLEKRR